MDYGIEIDPIVLQGFIEESKEALDNISPLFIELEKTPNNKDLINAIFRPIHSIKGNAPFFGLLRLKTLAHEFESLLAWMRTTEQTFDRSIFDILLLGVDELRAMLDRVASKQHEVIDEAQFESLIKAAKDAINSNSIVLSKPDILDSLDKILSWQLTESQVDFINSLKVAFGGVVKESNLDNKKSQNEDPKPTIEINNVIATQTPAPTPARQEGPKSMRIPEERIDTFLEFVGELVVAQDMLRHFSSRFDRDRNDINLTKDLQSINGVLSTLGAGLEKAIMSIRRVPIRTLIQKVPRIIRDIAKSKDKKIDITVEGDEIEIDKSLIELLDAPLMHMARNAADHGIEMPSERIKSGKSETGNVLIRCEESEKEMILTVSDNGAGLNYRALRNKAVSLGMIASDMELNESQIVNLLFMAGVSTATEVSDISGRGVGMDVVKRNIESAGGAIEVFSTAGQGTQFSIRVPKSVTTQIIQGFVFEVADIHYVVPMTNVYECWDYDFNNQTNIIDGWPCVQRHEKILSIVDLREIFETIPEEQNNTKRLALTVEVGGELVALLVDNVLGPRQLVLRSLDGFTNGSKVFLGGAVLGEGKIALVCDLNHLVDRFKPPSHKQISMISH